MPARRVATLALLVPFLPACTAWATYQDPIPTAFAGDPPPEVRVTTRDGRRVELRGPALAGDSLLGIEMLAGGSRQFTQKRVAMALDDVAKFETKRAGTAGTALIAIPVGAAFLYFVGKAMIGNPLEE